EASRQKYASHAKASHGVETLLVETACSGDGGTAEREDHGRRAGIEKLLQLRLEQLWTVVKDGSRTHHVGRPVRLRGRKEAGKQCERQHGRELPFEQRMAA